MRGCEYFKSGITTVWNPGRILLNEGARMYPVWMPDRELEVRVVTPVVGIVGKMGFIFGGFVSEEEESVRPESMSLAGS